MGRKEQRWSLLLQRQAFMYVQVILLQSSFLKMRRKILNQAPFDKSLLTIPTQSLQWVQSIVPEAGLPSPPIEIRNRIYHFLFLLTCNNRHKPVYKRHLSKFVNSVTYWSSPPTSISP